MYSKCFPHNTQKLAPCRFLFHKATFLLDLQHKGHLFYDQTGKGFVLPVLFFPAGDRGSNGTVLKQDRGGILHAGKSRSVVWKSIFLSIKSVFYKFHFVLNPEFTRPACLLIQPGVHFVCITALAIEILCFYGFIAAV